MGNWSRVSHYLLPITYYLLPITYYLLPCSRNNFFEMPQASPLHFDSGLQFD